MNGPAVLISKCFVNLSDPRGDRGRNRRLLEMLFITLTATICGVNSWADLERFANGKIRWFRRYIKLEHGVPSHDTIGRVFSVSARQRQGWLGLIAEAIAGSLHPDDLAVVP